MAGKGFVPEVLYQGKYYPICGHYFWDSQDGATTVCKALGFSSGKFKRTNAKYDVDSMPVGRCSKGQPLNKCTFGGNGWGNLNYRSGWCKKGTSIGVQVVCTGSGSTGKTKLARAVTFIYLLDTSQSICTAMVMGAPRFRS